MNYRNKKILQLAKECPSCLLCHKANQGDGMVIKAHDSAMPATWKSTKAGNGLKNSGNQTGNGHTVQLLAGCLRTVTWRSSNG